MGGILAGAAALLSGAAAAMGLGGGFVLLVYLTVVVGLPQLEAQWINLIFFLPIGSLALVFHLKNHLVEGRAVLPAVLTGLAGAAGGVLLAHFLGDQRLTRIFALFLAAIGIRELFFPGKKDGGQKR